MCLQGKSLVSAGSLNPRRSRATSQGQAYSLGGVSTSCPSDPRGSAASLRGASALLTGTWGLGWQSRVADCLTGRGDPKRALPWGASPSLLALRGSPRCRVHQFQQNGNILPPPRRSGTPRLASPRSPSRSGPSGSQAVLQGLAQSAPRREAGDARHSASTLCPAPGSAALRPLTHRWEEDAQWLVYQVSSAGAREGAQGRTATSLGPHILTGAGSPAFCGEV